MSKALTQQSDKMSMLSYAAPGTNQQAITKFRNNRKFFLVHHVSSKHGAHLQGIKLSHDAVSVA